MQRAGREAIEAKSRGSLVRLIARETDGRSTSPSRRRLEAAIAPAGVEVEPVDRRASMIGEPSIDMSMMPPQRRRRDSPEHRHHRHATFADVLHGRHIAALRVGVVPVEVAAEDQSALVGLAYVEMSGAEGDDAGNKA